MSNGGNTAGGCMCGAVRYEVQGEPVWIGYCHCESCRRHTGAPVVAYASFKRTQVEFTKGERHIYASSPGVDRSFCAHCGTPLTWEGVDDPARGPIIEVHIGTLDDANAFLPTNHLHYPERIAWFDVADGLPRYTGFDFNSDVCARGPARPESD